MTTDEFSSTFDTEVSSYIKFKGYVDSDFNGSVEFDEFEKSVFLTEAQEELVSDLYNGHIYDGFESTEQVRKYLDSLIKPASIDLTEEAAAGYTTKKGLYSYPVDFKTIEETQRLMYITYESVDIDDESLECGNGNTVRVEPVRHDELAKIAQNPFRGPNTSRVLRVDVGYKKLELVSAFKLHLYHILFLEKPTPIILENLEGLTIDGYSEAMTSQLDDSLHRMILQLAVKKAVASKLLQKQLST